MASFDDSINFVLDNEGGLSNNSADPGGLTNFGISQRMYPDLDIRNLTRDEAKEIYRKDYWNANFDAIQSSRVAQKLFDATVNMGPVKATRMLQLALGAIQAGPVVADGILGSHTIEAINAAYADPLVDEYKAQLCKYYFDLGKPEFLMGWLRRAVKG